MYQHGVREVPLAHLNTGHCVPCVAFTVLRCCGRHCCWLLKYGVGDTDNFVHSSRARKPHVSTMSAVAVYAVEAPSEEEEESEDEDSAPYHAAVGTMLSHIKGRINPRLFRKVSKYVTVERAVELHTERKILALLPADLKIQLAEERYSALIEGSRLFESCSGTNLTCCMPLIR